MMKTKLNTLVTLSISSWIGISTGAQHYYGVLTNGKATIKLEKVITKADLPGLNKGLDMETNKEGVNLK